MFGRRRLTREDLPGVCREFIRRGLEQAAAQVTPAAQPELTELKCARAQESLTGTDAPLTAEAIEAEHRARCAQYERRFKPAAKSPWMAAGYKARTPRRDPASGMSEDDLWLRQSSQQVLAACRSQLAAMPGGQHDLQILGLA